MTKDIDHLKVDDWELYPYLKQASFGWCNYSTQVQRIVITCYGQKVEDPEQKVSKFKAMLKDLIRQSQSDLCAVKRIGQIEEIEQLMCDRHLKSSMAHARLLGFILRFLLKR